MSISSRSKAALSLMLCGALAASPAASLAQSGEPAGALVSTDADDYALLAASDITLQAAADNWARLHGADRYGTMSAIADRGFEHAQWAIVATGRSFPDALGASALAGILDAPVLLTEPNGLSDQTAKQLGRLGVEDVYLMGGTAALSADVARQIEGLGISTHRLGGSTRYDTNLSTYEAVRDWGSLSHTVIVASGASFADALSMSPWAFATHSPVVLAGPDGTLPAESAKAIAGDPLVQRIVIAGGQGSVSDWVREQLGSEYEYVRLEGTDRYKTSAAIADWETSHGLSWSYPAVASGTSFPDALAAGPLCGNVGSVLLLGTSVSHPTVEALYEHRDEVVFGWLLGGTSSQPLTDPIGQYESRNNVLVHDVPWAGQPNNYYCGPTCGFMVLSKVGAQTSAAGDPLTIHNVANTMETSYYGYTSFTNHMFEKGMNRWLGKDVYQTVPNPSYEQLRAAVLHSFETGYPMVVDEHERLGGPHFNGHGDGNYSHILVIDGYNKATDAVLFADPGAETVWYGAARKFWYPSLRDFAQTYLAPYPWRDGIGMVCPR